MTHRLFGRSGRALASLATATALLGLPAFASAQSGAPFRIGMTTDMSSAYSDITGKGSVVATQMAVDDCLKAECRGMTIEVVSADHQNKADVGSNIARQWYDRDGVDAVFDVPTSSGALGSGRRASSLIT